MAFSYLHDRDHAPLSPIHNRSHAPLSHLHESRLKRRHIQAGEGKGAGDLLASSRAGGAENRGAEVLEVHLVDLRMAEEHIMKGNNQKGN